jgi:hypothetical protein
MSASQLRFSSTTPPAPANSFQLQFQHDSASPVDMSGYIRRIRVALTPSAGGNFTVAHGLGAMPTLVVITLTSLGQIVFQAATQWDATNIYLTASDGSVTGFAEIFA